MTEFTPWLSEATLEKLERPRQVYSLNPNPHAKNSPKVKDQATLWQVQARPGDPTSPFIWGHYALMMVCGGHWNSATSAMAVAKASKPKSTTTKADYENVLSVKNVEPDVKLSTSSTTGTLITVMLRAGFTWEEVGDTFERHAAAGGAYWCWMLTFPDEGALLEKWRYGTKYQTLNTETGEVEEKIIEGDDLSNISSSWNPWVGRYPLEDSSTHNFPITHRGSLGNREDSKKRTSKTVSYHELYLTASITRTIINLVILQTISFPTKDTSPWVVAETGQRVATSQTLKARIMGKMDGVLRNGYLPWLVERGVLIEHTSKIKKEEGGRGCTPKVGYTLNPEADLDALFFEYFDLAPTKAPEEAPQEAPQAPQKSMDELFLDLLAEEAPTPLVAPPEVPKQPMPKPDNTTYTNIDDLLGFTEGEAA